MKLHPRLPVLVLALAAGAAMAQSVYRHVDKNGKVTFSDQPPAANVQPAAPRAGTAASTGGPALPYELRQVVQRYPVTIYTGDECSPCSAGRSLLVTRGIPFEERIIKSNEDVEALQRLSGQTSLPVLSIGAQHLKGFSDPEWSQYLDAAGYPKSAQLPAGYRNPPATPLVAVQAAPQAAVRPPAAAPATAPQTPPTPAEGPTPSNPTGIKF
ncbi:DUF4124 domain-containing protein [Variovorax sp. JS1663]|uniref:DUF4124 domain-containing protein n=1 Tax=Variovorax sp. JS1663 TaxID=1851577 RepID=UPI000B347642|nr:DUF4124 domain-containing protein [Variovorax sp. JS1663]OUL98963.1 NrdH-redoxin [Variovorax sp. JS1663]